MIREKSDEQVLEEEIKREEDWHAGGGGTPLRAIPPERVRHHVEDGSTANPRPQGQNTMKITVAETKYFDALYIDDSLVLSVPSPITAGMLLVELHDRSVIDGIEREIVTVDQDWFDGFSRFPHDRSELVT